MKTFLITLVALIAIPLSFAVVADVVIIAHPSLPINEISDKYARRIFLGKSSYIDDNLGVFALDQKDGAIKEEFYLLLTKKSLRQIKVHRIKMLMSGKGMQPVELDSDVEVIKRVASDPSAIGYISVENMNDSVKVLKRLISHAKSNTPPAGD